MMYEINLDTMSQITPYDPCGHTKLSVSDYKKSYSFYADIFDGLGYKQVSKHDDSAGWASPNGYGIWIEQADITDHPYTFSAPGLHHLCFRAQSTEAVGRIYKRILEKSAYVFDAPQKYPNYTNKYYAVFFADPDGIKLEVAYY
jgi:catechol 2,3-dioxygenase-like lactoylglutathione lyase family enzyme